MSMNAELARGFTSEVVFASALRVVPSRASGVTPPAPFLCPHWLTPAAGTADVGWRRACPFIAALGVEDLAGGVFMSAQASPRPS